MCGPATGDRTARETPSGHDDGHIGGLNGTLLGVAVANSLRGACLLGEMPHIFALDRLGVLKEYEDRFLDLFKKRE